MLVKAMVLHDYAQPLEAREVDVPKIGPDEVLVRVRACGVCRTDLKIIRGFYPTRQKLPVIPGHEPAGEVVEVGPQVVGVKPGDRVACYAYITCGRCEFCRTGRDSLCLNPRGQLGMSVNGGYAEYLKAPEANVFKLPDNVTFEQGAILVDAVATPYHAVKRGRVQIGQTVGVVGVGGLGIHVVEFAKLAGARVVAADVRDEALDLARKYGADEVIDRRTQDFAVEAKRLTDGLGFDVVIDAIGFADQISSALHGLKRGGRFVHVGYFPGHTFPLDPGEVMGNEWELLGSRASNKAEQIEVLNLVAAGRIRPVVTAEFPLAEANELLRLVDEGKIIGRGVLKP